jgi:hypothetical protein
MNIEVVNELPEPVWMPGAELMRLFERRSTAPVGQFYELPAPAIQELQELMLAPSALEAALAQLLQATATELPPDLDQRDYAQRLIAVRRGQWAFRQGLLQAFDRTCCISGSQVEATLEAAHIRPFRETGSHALGNGLLLRADLHTLFDLRLITVMPFGAVRVAPDLRGSEYEDFDERQIRRPVDPAHSPDRSALSAHNALCDWLE